MTTERAWPDVAIPPGEFLAETLDALDISQAELARRAGRPVQAINEIVQGKKEITPETAIDLERVLGTPAHLWVRLSADYRYTKARIDDRQRLRDEVPHSQAFPYGLMARAGWVQKTSDPLERVGTLLTFFAVSSLSNLELPTVAYRRSRSADISDKSLLAWLRKGDIDAAGIEVKAFDEHALREILPTIRRMTVQAPDAFEAQLRSLLAERGVAFVVVPHLTGAPVNGATRWLGGKAVLQMSIRYRWQDVFWFTLFHELAHLLLHGRRERFIEVPESAGPKEEEANRFAAEQLIPSASYAAFLKRVRPPRIPVAAVEEFARAIGIAPGIVVGRLQHDGHLRPSHLNGLRRQFVLRGPGPTTR